MKCWTCSRHQGPSALLSTVHSELPAIPPLSVIITHQLLANLYCYQISLFVLLTCSKQQVIQAHPELKLCIGMDVDPLAHEKAQAQICSLLHDHPNLKPYTFVKNFKHIKSLLNEVDQDLLNSGVDGILMDLGMSSMQVLYMLIIISFSLFRCSDLFSLCPFQVNNPQRGFSVLGNGPLDMRMDPHVRAFIDI